MASLVPLNYTFGAAALLHGIAGLGQLFGSEYLVKSLNVQPAAASNLVLILQRETGLGNLLLAYMNGKAIFSPWILKKLVGQCTTVLWIAQTTMYFLMTALSRQGLLPHVLFGLVYSGVFGYTLLKVDESKENVERRNNE